MNEVFLAVPSILLGVIIPAILLLLMVISSKRVKVSFVSVLYGFGSFLFSLIAVFVLLLVMSQILFPSISISGETDANVYVSVGGAIILLLFYLISEAFKQISFAGILKSQKQVYAGTTFGCGFVLAQNLLILGLIYTSEIDLSQAVVFGLLMMVSGLIYILLSTSGYRLAAEKQRIAGSAISVSYYLLFLVMILFSNMFLTYLCLALILLFALVVAYVVLPLPFKKEKRV